MKVLMICGVFAKQNEQEVIAQARGAVEFSANLFQQKLIGGFRDAGCELSVLSAPFIGAYPITSRSLRFKGFSYQPEGCRYVRFNNLWAVRNLSRAASLKRAVRSFIDAEDDQKMILVYSAHTPFIEAAVYAKRKDPRIKVCLMVPDLPEFMNLSAKRSVIYDVAKKVDIAVMKKLMEQVDFFVLLTEQMKELLPVGDKPCRVVEGIVSDAALKAGPDVPAGREKYVVYTGKLDESFGVKALIDAFSFLDDPDYRLILCGTGDSGGYAGEASRKDSRIRALGQVPPEEARAWQKKAAVLVNPRANVGEYTQYSFPSKNIEYLLMGKPVVAYMLHGMPACYRDFIYEIDPGGNAAEAIARAVRFAIADEARAKKEKYDSYLCYAKERLTAQSIAGMMLELCGNL